MTSEDKERTVQQKNIKLHSRAPTRGTFIFYIVFVFIHTYN